VFQAFVRDCKFPVDVSQQFKGGEAGVENQCGAVVFIIKLLKYGPQDRGLARSDFAGEFNEAGMIFDAVNKVSKSLLMVLAQINEPWVRRDVERFFPETVMRAVHLFLLLGGFVR